MKKLLGAVIGGSIGFITPLVLAVGNETLFIKKQLDNGSQIWDVVQICAFERRWFPLYPKVIHAPGCQNKTLGILPGLLLLSTPAGLAIGAILSKDKRSSRRTADVISRDSSQIAESVAVSVPEQTPDPAETVRKDAPKPSIPAIDSQFSQGFQRLKEVNWVKAGAGAAVAAVVVIFGISTLGGNKSEKQESGVSDGLISTKKKGQQQIMVLQSVGRSFGANNPDFEIPVSDRFSICKSKNNAITNDELNQKLANGASIVSQGTQITISVKYTTFSSVPCNLITYIIEE